jgi:hypothetical protein
VKTTPAIACPVAALLLTGCISTQNDRITIGQTVRLEGFAASPVPPAAGTIPPGEQVQVPSITSLDRSNWQTTPIFVPVDGTAHNPTYAKRVLVTDLTRRQQRRYPTAQSGLELYGGSERQQQVEALYNDGMAGLDILLLLPRMVWNRPWQTRWSPDESFQRYWHPERADAEAPPVIGEPYSKPEPQPVTP